MGKFKRSSNDNMMINAAQSFPWTRARWTSDPRSRSCNLAKALVASPIKSEAYLLACGLLANRRDEDLLYGKARLAPPTPFKILNPNATRCPDKLPSALGHGPSCNVWASVRHCIVTQCLSGLTFTAL